MASNCWRYPELDMKQTSYPWAMRCFATAIMGMMCPDTGVQHISTSVLRRIAIVVTQLSCKCKTGQRADGVLSFGRVEPGHNLQVWMMVS